MLIARFLPGLIEVGIAPWGAGLVFHFLVQRRRDPVPSPRDANMPRGSVHVTKERLGALPVDLQECWHLSGLGRPEKRDERSIRETQTRLMKN